MILRRSCRHLLREEQLSTGHPFTQKQDNLDKLPEQGAQHKTSDFWAALLNFELWTEKHWKQLKRKVRFLQRALAGPFLLPVLLAAFLLTVPEPSAFSVPAKQL